MQSSYAKNDDEGRFGRVKVRANVSAHEDPVADDSENKDLADVPSEVRQAVEEARRLRSMAYKRNNHEEGHVNGGADEIEHADE